MATSDIQNEVIAASIDTSATASGEQVYPMSRQGKRQSILLLLGVASIWIFALWTLITILQDGVGGVEWVSLTLMAAILVVAPVVMWTLLEEANSRIVTSSKGVSYQSIGGINLAYDWEEIEGFKGKEGRGRMARFFLGNDTTEDTINNIAHGVEAGEPRLESNNTPTSGEQSEGEIPAGDEVEDEEPETLLIKVRNDRTLQIANPLIRFLHRQAHGPHLPIYGGLENRAQLVREITAHAAEQPFTPLSNA